MYFGDILITEATETVAGFREKFPGAKVVFKKCDVLVQSEVEGVTSYKFFVKIAMYIHVYTRNYSAIQKQSLYKDEIKVLCGWT